MDKPFDIADLGKKLKEKGLDVAEEALKILATETLEWTQESCLIHPNALVKLGAPVVAAVKPFVLSEIDKIDGQPG